MEVYSVDEDDLRQIPPGNIEYEENLEEHLLKAEGAVIGGVDILYVSQQGTAEATGVFDILGVDENGDTVIVELKRGKTPRRVVAQALEYASGIRQESYAELQDRYENFRRSRGEDDPESLREAHAGFFLREDEPLDEGAFNTTQRIVVVGTQVGETTLHMADLLREHGLDVVCVEYQAFESDEDELTLLTTENVRRPLTQEGGDGDLTDTERLQQAFWEAFGEKLADYPDSPLYIGGMNPDSYLPQKQNLPTGIDYALTTNIREKHLEVKLHLRGEQRGLFEYLSEHRDEIENQIATTLDEENGEHFEWNTGSSYDSIILRRDGNINAEDKWDDYLEWFIEYGGKFDEVFGAYVREYRNE